MAGLISTPWLHVGRYYPSSSIPIIYRAIMNRIEQSNRPPKPHLSANCPTDVSSASFAQSHSSAPHAVFAPLHYERNYAYPLIVWLHGRRDDERQLLRVMPLVSMRNYVAVAPRGLRVADDSGGYGWPQDAATIEHAGQRVFDLIDAVADKYHFSPRRVFLAGFDDGGTMAFRLAMNYPNRFAGALSLCGPFPTGQTPLGRLDEIRGLPIFLAVGRDSRCYPPEQVCEDLRLLHTAGLSITLRQYPCCHEISPQMLRDVDRWIIEQITAPTET